MAGAKEPIAELVEGFETHDVTKLLAMTDAGARIDVLVPALVWGGDRSGGGPQGSGSQGLRGPGARVS